MKKLKVLELIALVALVIVFFVTAFSTMHNVVKAVIIAGSLFASGAIIARLTNSTNNYGVVIVRGKYGFNLMKDIAQKHPRFVNALADLGLSLGFGSIYSFFLFKNTPKKLFAHLLVLLLLFATASFTSSIPVSPLLLQVIGVLFGLAGVGFASIALNAFAIFTIPETPAGVLPVVPGVTVPFEAIFAIALIAIVHETAHGVLFFIEKLKVKHSGLLLLGFLPIGAFVEPDEAKFKKHAAHGRRRILVAGSASNFYTMLVLLPFAALVAMFLSTLVSGVLISSVSPGSPADGLLSPGDVVISANSVSVLSLAPFVSTLQKAGAGEVVSLELLSGKKVDVKLDDAGKMGVQVGGYVESSNALLHTIVSLFASVLNWSVLLSLALAMINLLPLFITDGHHLIGDEVSRLFPKNPQLAKLTTNALAGIVLLLLLFNMFPFLK